MSKLERALAEADDIEVADHTAGPDLPLPAHVKVSQPGRARSKVLQVRLNPDELAALEAIAARRELPVSTVAREQLLRLVTDEAAEVDPLCGLMEASARINEFAHEVRRRLGPDVAFPPDGRLVQK